MSRVDLLREIEQIVNGIPSVTTNLIVDYYSQVPSLKTSSVPVLYPYPTNPLKKQEVKNYLTMIGKINEIKFIRENSIIDIDKVVFNPTATSLKPN
jgi:hypothetical protein